MKDYPYFKAYVAEILFDTMGMSQAQKGDYLDSLLLAWKTMNPEKMPQWMQEYADDTIKKSGKLSENSKIRWSNAMQLHTKCNANAMQTAYIEDRRGEDRIGEEKPPTPKKGRIVSEPVLIPESLKLIEGFTESWAQWILHLCEKKKKPTPTAQRLQLKKLATMSNPVLAICNSIERNYQGIFDPTENGSRKFESTQERINRENLVRWEEMQREEKLLFLGNESNG